jgi:hypothetical protein
VGQGDGQGHALGSFGGGVAEHDPLVAGAELVPGIGGASLGLHGFEHGLGDIRRLLPNEICHSTGIRGNPVLGFFVAHIAEDPARDLSGVDAGCCGDLPSYDDEALHDEGFAGHPPHGILGKDGIQNGVGDAVRQFIRVPLGYGFRGDEFSRHSHLLLGDFVSSLSQKALGANFGWSFCLR